MCTAWGRKIRFPERGGGTGRQNARGSLRGVTRTRTDKPATRSTNSSPLTAPDVHIVENSEPPGGIGECGASAIVPAVANAIFAATGKRLRKMPVDSAALKQPV
jgi:isoquinoline 1-oxidoreductase subunit beta